MSASAAARFCRLIPRFVAVEPAIFMFTSKFNFRLVCQTSCHSEHGLLPRFPCGLMPQLASWQLCQVAASRHRGSAAFFCHGTLRPLLLM